jgi:uncharacterized protein
MNNSFFSESSRALQDKFDSRRIADRITGLRRKSQFDEWEFSVIEDAQFFFIASASKDGRPDCSIKSGDKGFVKIIKPNCLLFPDYDGNGMFRTLGNVIENPYVGMLFLELTGDRRKLRVNGIASISEDVQLLNQFPGSKLVIRITAFDVFPNCPRYAPKIEVKENSIYLPNLSGERVEPPWKLNPDYEPFLPKK